MSRMESYGNAASAIVIITLLLVFSWLFALVSFPAFEYQDDSLDRELVPMSEFDDIANHAARFLWDHRALDLTGQAFVIVAAVVCCLALLKQTEEAH